MNTPHRWTTGAAPVILRATLVFSLLLGTLLFNVVAAHASPPGPTHEYELTKLPPGAMAAPISAVQVQAITRNPKMDSALSQLAAASQGPQANVVMLAEAQRVRLSGDRVQVLITTDALGQAQLRYRERAAHASQSYSGLYPSLNATYNLSENLILRAAFAKSA